VVQLYPQPLGANFSRLLRHSWAMLGLFFTPGHHTGDNLYFSPNIITVIESYRMRCAEREAHMVEMINTYEIFVGNL
jgi:hypothetical protein